MPVLGQEQGKKRGAPLVNEIVSRVNDNTKRLRLLEERERLLTSRISSMDESLFGKIKGIEEAMGELDSRLKAQDEKLETFGNTLKEIIKQIRFLANKTEVKRVEEKLKILEPILTQIAAGQGIKPQQ